MADISKIQPMGDSTQYTLQARTDSNGDVIKDTYLHLSGGTMTGPLTTHVLRGTQDIDYGTSLPDTGTEGQIFFLLSDPYYELPAGGTAGLVLMKRTTEYDRDVSWSSTASISITGNAATATSLTSSAGSSTIPIYFSNGKPTLCSTTLGVSITGSSASCTGNAATATALTSNAGSSTVPIYFSGGKPVQCSTTLGVSITGSAGSVAWGNVTGKPSTYSPASHTHNYAASPSAGGPASSVRTYGSDILIGTANSSTNDSGDIVWLYGNGNEKSRIWTDNEYGSGIGPNYRVYNASGTCLRSSRLWAMGESITGAVWNDYAEYRQTDIIEFGRCVVENGNDTMSLSNKRLQKGCAITSDTWGFAQGETEKAQTPIAVSGRVLAYPYENKEKFRKHIGDAVCSGPNGTVSIMRWWEIILFPTRIIGTISAIPDYEEWGGGELADRPPVKVNGRVWIQI